MPDPEPEPENPLSPYFPADVPRLPGNGRRWFALLVVAVLVLGTLLHLVLGLGGWLGA